MKAHMNQTWQKSQDEGEAFTRCRLRMQALLEAGFARRICIACSGGLDSVVLLHTLTKLCRELGSPVVLEVWHVNYGLRGAESDADAAFVASSSAGLGLVCQTLTVSAEQRAARKNGIQEWARQLRYDWFHSLLQEGDLLALAHHADDLAETVLMRLARGAHLGQWQGMQELQLAQWRPFLEVSRATLEEVAKRQKLQHREDSSNAKLVYSRNRIRHLILPELEQLYPGVRRQLCQLAQDASEFVAYASEGAARQGLLRAGEIQSLPDAVARQRIALLVQGDRHQDWLSRTVLTALLSALRSGSALTLEVRGERRVRVEAGRLWVEAAERPRSARWSQYSRALLAAEPQTCLVSGVSFQPSKPLDAGARIVDNE